MDRHRTAGILTFVIIAGFALSTSVTAAGGDSTSRAAKYFESIHLSAEGVLAEDTLGLRWRYQFDSLRWIVETKSAGGRREAAHPEAAARRCTEGKSLSGIQSTVLLGYEEFTEHDIIARGNVTVKGWAKGDVTSFTGRVVVNDGARVDGNITAPEIDVRPGGDVRGAATITTPLGATVDFLWPDPYTTAWYGFWISVGILGLSCILILLFGRSRLGNVTQCLEEHHGRALLTGLLAIVATPVLAMVLLFTLVGLLLIPFLPVLLLVAGSAGLIWVGCELTIRSVRKTPRHVCLRWGWIVVLALLAVGWYLAIDGWQFKRWERGGQVLLLAILGLLTLYLLAAGIGAVLLTRLGRRPYLRLGAPGDGSPAPDETLLRPELPAVSIPRYARTERPVRRTPSRPPRG